MPLDLITKIPKKILINIENKRDKEFIVQIDNIGKYQPSKQASKLLAILYKNYFATDEEKRTIKAKEKNFYIIEQEKLREKFNPNDIFKKNKNETQKDNINKCETENHINASILIESKMETFYSRIINFIKKIFHI